MQLKSTPRGAVGPGLPIHPYIRTSAYHLLEAFCTRIILQCILDNGGVYRKIPTEQSVKQ